MNIQPKLLEAAQAGRTLEELASMAAANHQLDEQFVKALITMESGWDPALTDSACCWGLLQNHAKNARGTIDGTTLDDFNKAHGTTYVQEDTLDPTVSLAVGCYTLSIILRALRAAGIVTNAWDERSATVLAWAWVAGWSPSRGVIRAYRQYMAGKEERGALDVIPAIAFKQLVTGEDEKFSRTLRDHPRAVYKALELGTPQGIARAGVADTLGIQAKLDWAMKVGALAFRKGWKPARERAGRLARDFLRAARPIPLSAGGGILLLLLVVLVLSRRR